MRPSKKIDELERKKWDLLKKRAAVFDSLFDLGDRKTLATRIEKELDDIELEIITLKRPEFNARINQ